jgi:hypothetical protein
MGEIKKILLQKDLPERELHNSRMFVDLSENIHIHFRELRLMFGVEEFVEFCSILGEGAKDIKKYLKKNPGYKEQEVFDGILIGGGAKRQLIPLQMSPEPHTSKYFPNRLQIELQDESVIDAIHIHYRDFRLVMTITTFREFVDGMKEALAQLDELLQIQDYRPEVHPFRKVVAKKSWRRERMNFLDRIKHKIKKILGYSEIN